MQRMQRVSSNAPALNEIPDLKIYRQKLMDLLGPASCCKSELTAKWAVQSRNLLIMLIGDSNLSIVQ